MACTRRSPRSAVSRTSSAAVARSTSSWTVSPAVVAGQDEQRADEVLGMIDGDADVRRHGKQVVGGAVRVADDIDRRAHDGERGAQFMRSVGDELSLALERGLESFEHVVECLGQFAQFVAGTARRDHADRLCSEASRAAAVIRCTGRSDRPEKIQPRIAPRSHGECAVPCWDKSAESAGNRCLGTFHHGVVRTPLHQRFSQDINYSYVVTATRQAENWVTVGFESAVRRPCVDSIVKVDTVAVLGTSGAPR